jgi:hypothetical protein
MLLLGKNKPIRSAALTLTLTLLSAQRLDANGSSQLLRVVGRPDYCKSSLRVFEALGETQSLGFFGIVRLRDERSQTADMAIPEPDIGRLPGFKAFGVPVTGEHAFAGK